MGDVPSILRMVPCLVMLASGCSTEADPGEPRCADPLYGNGTCDLDTSCSYPDIDCFLTFDDQASAQTWWTSNAFAAGQPTAPASDPRFANVKAALDEGWTAYKATHDVGDLAAHEVQLVLINIPTMRLGAFVSPTAGRDKAALAVFVELPFLSVGLTQDEILSVMMHELEHAVGLHVIPAVTERTARFYSAPGTSEPFGGDQPDNAGIRSLYKEWTVRAGNVGYLGDTELAGLPLYGIGGSLGDAFAKIVAARAAATPAPCAASKARLDALETQVLNLRAPLDGSVNLASTAPTTIVDVLNQLTSECFMGVTGDAIHFTALALAIDEATLRGSLSAEVRTAVEGKAVIAGFYNWVALERTHMRDVQTRFQTLTGTAWGRLRYFSTEEAADDSSVSSMAALGLSGDLIGSALVKLEKIEAMCQPLVDGGQPIPYGENLIDTHHATCWRAGNARRFADRVAGAPRYTRPPLLPADDTRVFALPTEFVMN